MKFNKKYFPQKPFVLGVSGGIDSVAVCHFFKKIGLDFFAAHVNNKFIPQDDETSKKVLKFFKKFGINGGVVEAKEKYKSGSKEEFCRNVRYKHLEKYTKLYYTNFLVTAHHLNDCVESYLMNCLKGHSDHTPIPYITVRESGVFVVRPFLTTPKKDFIQYVDKNNLSEYVTEDELNNDLSLTRNWMRKEIIPTIEKRYKGLEKVVFKKVFSHMEKYQEKL